MMESKIDLKEIEQKTFRESNQDGLLELVMGICIATILHVFRGGIKWHFQST